MKICEIFDSIQGEGLFIGQPTTFIRLSGCNLNCSWCDTEYARREGTEMALKEIVQRIKQPSCCLTGGEPMLQPIHELMKYIKAGTSITVETNGTIMPQDSMLFRVDLWSISPKLGSSGMKPNVPVLKEFTRRFYRATLLQYKFVIADQDDLDETYMLLQQLDDRIPIILQPQAMFHKKPLRRTSYLVKLGWLVERVTSEERWHQFNVRILPQLHRVLWPSVMRGR